MPLHVTEENNELVKGMVGLASGQSAAPLDAIQPLETPTNLTKLALTDVAVGQEVLITEEANRLEKYMGPIGGEAKAGLTVSGAGVADVNITMARQGTESGAPYYSLTGGFGVGVTSVYKDSNFWVIESVAESGVVYFAEEDVDYPWLVQSWQSAVSSYDPPPIITRNDIASDENWIVLRNTVELWVAVKYGDQDPFEINGVPITQAETWTYVGWVQVDSIPYLADWAFFDMIVQATVYQNNPPGPPPADLIPAGSAGGSVGVLGYTGHFALPTPLLPRSVLYLPIIDG